MALAAVWTAASRGTCRSWGTLMRRHRTVVALTLVASVSVTAHAGVGIVDPRDPRAFFVGKTMTYIIASAPGEATTRTDA